jgi:hypothetical protein
MDNKEIDNNNFILKYTRIKNKARATFYQVALALFKHINVILCTDLVPFNPSYIFIQS